MLRTVPSVPYNGLTSSFLNGGGMFSFPVLGAATWNAIGAATGDASTDNGTNQISYRVAQTLGSGISWRFTESAAGVAGGLPVLLQVDTVAASTALPLLIKARGNEFFRVGADGQVIVNYSATNDFFTWLQLGNTTTGFGGANNRIEAYSNNSLVGGFAGSIGIGLVNGNWFGISASNDWASADAQLHRDAADIWAIRRGANAQAFRIYGAGASAAAGDFVGRKSRGTAETPTVISGGDDLLSLTGYGYAGVTNTYIPAAQILYDTSSTVTDSANGIGGVIDVRAQLAGSGTSTLPTILRISGSTKHVTPMGTVPAITAGGGTSPSIVGTDHSFKITVGSGGIAQSVTATFGRAWTNAPQCVANHQGAILVLRCVSTTTTVVIDAATPFTAGGLIDVICQGYE